MAYPEGDEALEAETGGLDKQREDSDGGTGEAEKEEFPVTLKYPSAPILVWEHFAKEIDAFQAEIIKGVNHDIRHMRVTAAEAPSPTVPMIHNTPYAGFRVTKTDVFRVQLSDGSYVNSKR